MNNPVNKTATYEMHAMKLETSRLTGGGSPRGNQEGVQRTANALAKSAIGALNP
jgi:hypothetical protein